jgi:WD40 repeat protein
LRHEGPVLGVAFSPDGRWLATASADRTAVVWNAATGDKRFSKPLQHNGDVLAIEFSLDGRRLVTASADGTARLWDAANGCESGLG